VNLLGTVREACEQVEARGGNAVELHLSVVRELLEEMDHLRLQVVELERESDNYRAMAQSMDGKR
jgi:hypothetical protein